MEKKELDKAFRAGVDAHRIMVIETLEIMVDETELKSLLNALSDAERVLDLDHY